MFVLINGEYVKRNDSEKIFSVEIPYEQHVVLLIRERYSIDEELAIQRQRDTKPEEFQAYFVYCEDCKRRAGSL